LFSVSIEELFPLIEFCKNGDLKAVSDWIGKGNPLDLPPRKKTRRASPLQIAIEKGFLTLTEVLLNGGAESAVTRRTKFVYGSVTLKGERHSIQ
jgi:hypothetical protein